MSAPLTVRRRIRASAAALFDAWTDPNQLRQWWGPDGVTCPRAEVDLRVGGRYRIDNQLPDGRVLTIEGEFLEIRPPERLVYTWRTQPDAAPERVTVRFEADAEHTEVTVVHERIEDEAKRRDHEAGWIGCLEGLAHHAPRV